MVVRAGSPWREAPAASPIDGAALRARLSAAARTVQGDPSGQRRAAVDLLGEALAEGRADARRRLEHGSRGEEVARMLSATADAVIGALYDFTTVHVIRARNPTVAERISLLAVGGYGRGALAPFSDIDLLFLRPYKETAHGESTIEFILYVLWDLGLKVGHASRTVDDCLKLARADLTVKTTLLETRALAGEPRLAETLARRFRAEVAEGTGRDFIEAKLAERDARHARAGVSRFMVEPNVKDGKGGLRDLHTIGWIDHYISLADPPAAGPFAERGEGVPALFDEREARSWRRARDFLQAVRAHLHWAAGRAQDRLTFDLQPEIARRVGYHASADGDPCPAVERLMRRYFLIARDVGALTRVCAARLEAGQLKSAPGGLLRLFPGGGAPARIREKAFRVEDGRLGLARPDVFERDPVNLLRLFRIAGEADLDPHPDALAAAHRRLDLADAKLRGDPRAARSFLAVLRGPSAPRVLELMNETGVLGRYLPEFGRIVGRTQFNRYHAYTVDEHSLRAVAEAVALLEGALAAEAPVIAHAIARIADPEALLLTMLLHDVGKGSALGQQEAGASAAVRACNRLGIVPARAELIGWLVGHHLLMSETAQRRDIADPATISAFARVVETPERLRLLLAITVADIRAVGPNVWNAWKARLLGELHMATEAVFRGGRLDEFDAAARSRQRVYADGARAELEQGLGLAARSWAESLEDAYFSQFDPDDWRAHFALREQAAGQQGAAVQVAWRQERGAIELAVVARDRPRLFADLARALAQAGGDVAGARIFTTRSGEALDIFYLRGGDQEVRAGRFTEAVLSAARGETRPAGRAASPLRRPSPFVVAASVAIHEDEATGATLVEASGHDRPGLLADLAGALADAGLSIQSAHVESYGERAVDAFYVGKASLGQPADARRLASVRQRLAALMNEPAS